MKRVTKAVFPAAGMGTRFLPATKANPKEMLPIVDKPLIQYAAEEAMAAGITARKLRGIQPDTAYTYGLFHNAAVPVMMRRFKDYRALMDQAARDGFILAQEENRRYHCSHAVVGGLLARNWGLPATIANAIRHHHEPDLYGPARPYLDDASLALVAVTQVAEHLLAGNLGQANPECEASFEPAVAYLAAQSVDHPGLGGERRDPILRAAPLQSGVPVLRPHRVEQAAQQPHHRGGRCGSALPRRRLGGDPAHHGPSDQPG